MLDKSYPHLKPGYKTKEFYLTALLLLGGVYTLFTSRNVILWSYGVTLLCSGYPVSRRLMKRGRGVLLRGGEKSTELYVTLAGIISLILAHFFFPIDSGIVFLESTIIVTVWSIAVGHSKSLPPKTTILK